jgi:DNA-directed RNA polymerase specialized sigma24 family protein
VHDRGCLPKALRNPGGYLARVIFEDTPPPAKYIAAKADEAKGRAAVRALEEQKVTARNTEVWEREEAQALQIHLEELSPEALETFDADVLHGLSPAELRTFESISLPTFRDKTFNAYRLNHWRKTKS